MIAALVGIRRGVVSALFAVRVVGFGVGIVRVGGLRCFGVLVVMAALIVTGIRAGVVTVV